MKIKVSKRYLAIPISDCAVPKNIQIWKDGVLKDDFTIRADYVNPQYTAYYDLSGYMGCDITIISEPVVKMRDIQTDIRDCSQYHKYFMRPKIHFSAEFGWINDPNGLLEYISPVTGKKTYHMFFQYNPYDTVWNNMHWGHAVSDDLISWKQLETAIFPDESGTVFSGSGYVDKENLSGLKEGGEDPILLYYTCAGNTSALSQGKEFNQCLAYSVDGGKTFKKYSQNPLIGHIVSSNRDPKAVWCKELNCYVMTFYLAEGTFAVYTSQNLLDWTLLQNIAIGDRECPDLFPLCADGNRDDVKWILMGASHMYAVLEIKNGKFEVIQESTALEYGKNSYASQTFANVSDGRCISIAWAKNINLPGAPFKSHMSIPCERTLIKTENHYRLCSNPIRELRDYYVH